VAVEEGSPAPDFTLRSDDGDDVTLSSLKGSPVVLYFYPKDDTPGCTAQACGIRDAWGEFEKAGAVVLGVSPDGEGSHEKFKEKYGLPFTLLADTEKDLEPLKWAIIRRSACSRCRISRNTGSSSSGRMSGNHRRTDYVQVPNVTSRKRVLDAVGPRAKHQL